MTPPIGKIASVMNPEALAGKLLNLKASCEEINGAVSDFVKFDAHPDFATGHKALTTAQGLSDAGIALQQLRPDAKALHKALRDDSLFTAGVGGSLETMAEYKVPLASHLGGVMDAPIENIKRAVASLLNN